MVEGEDVISFGVGEPDFPTPDFIKDAAVEAIEKDYTCYTDFSGLPELKKAAVEKFASDYDYQYSDEEVIVCNGGKQVLYNALAAIIDEGDEVLIPKPYWVSYPEIVKLVGGQPVFIETKAENSYKVTAQELKASLSDKTKAIIINSPSNPDGHIYSEFELKELIDIISEEDLFIISDEIYDKLIYDQMEFNSLIELFPELKDKILIANGMSKSYCMTGWRVGFGFANKEWVENMAKIQSHTTSNVNTIAQYASFKALENKDLDKIIAERTEIYEKRRNTAYDILSGINGLEVLKPAGAFYFFIDISKFIGKEIQNITIEDSISFSKILLKEEKVAVVPGIAFGMENFVRISFTLKEERIREGLKRIADFAEKVGL